METKIIARVNNVDILSTSDQQLVPIKPICEALGIDRKNQQEKIKEHPILASTGVLSTLVAADGKEREMFCLPLQFVFGWLFTINPANVAEDAREAVIKYQLECYQALYRHFTARASFVEHKQKEIDRQLAIVEEARDNFRSAKYVMADAEARLKKLRSLTMDDYDLEKRQLKFDF